MIRAMTRQQVADCAGVDRKTLYNYFECHKEELQALGMRPRQLLPPSVVEWLMVNYGLHIEDYP